MKREDIQKLLGGYATGTLTAEERELLFSAALEDQTLFDALAREEPLRELLAEPATRQLLLEDLRPPASIWSRLWEQLTPRRLAWAGGLAMVVLVVSGVLYVRNHPSAPKQIEVAMNGMPESVSAPRQVTAPVAEPVKPSAATPRETATAGKRRDETAIEPEKKTEKDKLAEFAPREEADSTARDQRISANAVPAPSTAAAPPAPASTESRVDDLRKVDRLGDARVTDVNGTIVSIGAGANAGLKVGETLEIIRDGRVISTVRLTQVGSTFAVGPIQPTSAQPLSANRQSAGAVAGGLSSVTTDHPRAGDSVRLAVPAPPQK